MTTKINDNARSKRGISTLRNSISGEYLLKSKISTSILQDVRCDIINHLTMMPLKLMS